MHKTLHCKWKHNLHQTFQAMKSYTSHENLAVKPNNEQSMLCRHILQAETGMPVLIWSNMSVKYVASVMWILFQMAK